MYGGLEGEGWEDAMKLELWREETLELSKLRKYEGEVPKQSGS